MAKDKLYDTHNAAKVPLRDKQNHKPTPLPANKAWTLDLRSKKDDAGVVHTVFNIVDRGTGAVLTHTTIKNTKFFTFAGFVLLAIFRHGKPDAIYTETDSETDTTEFDHIKDWVATLK